MDVQLHDILRCYGLHRYPVSILIAYFAARRLNDKYPFVTLPVKMRLVLVCLQGIRDKWVFLVRKTWFRVPINSELCGSTMGFYIIPIKYTHGFSVVLFLFDLKPFRYVVCFNISVRYGQLPLSLVYCREYRVKFGLVTNRPNFDMHFIRAFENRLFWIQELFAHIRHGYFTRATFLSWKYDKGTTFPIPILYAASCCHWSYYKDTLSPFYWHGLTLILAWNSNYMHG